MLEYNGVHRNGLTVPPKDADALREALERPLSDPELRARFVEAALERTERFGIEVTYAQVERLLERTAGIQRVAEAGC